MGFLHPLGLFCTRTTGNPEKRVFELLGEVQGEQPGRKLQNRPNLKLSVRKWDSAVWGNVKQVWLAYPSTGSLTHNTHFVFFLASFLLFVNFQIIFLHWKDINSSKTVLKRRRRNFKANVYINPWSADFVLIKREIILGGFDLISWKLFKRGLRILLNEGSQSERLHTTLCRKISGGQGLGRRKGWIDGTTGNF